MRVSIEAADRFIGLYMRLLHYAGQQRETIPLDMSFEKFLAQPTQVKVACREAIYEPAPLLDDFMMAYDSSLSIEDQKVVIAWTRYVKSTFLVLRHLKKHTIFLESTSPPNAYGVLGLTTDLEELLPAWRLPIGIQAVLLPYEGVVVCDGLISVYDIVIGPNMRSGLNEDYKNIKNAGRFFTTL